MKTKAREYEDERVFQNVFGSVDPLCRGNFFDEASKRKTPVWCRGNLTVMNTKTPEWVHVMKDPVVDLEDIFAKEGCLPKTKGIRMKVFIDKSGNKVEKVEKIAPYAEREKGSPFRKSPPTTKKDTSPETEDNAVPPLNIKSIQYETFEAAVASSADATKEKSTKPQAAPPAKITTKKTQPKKKSKGTCEMNSIRNPFLYRYWPWHTKELYSSPTMQLAFYF
mgnify:CR=1 FL=1